MPLQALNAQRLYQQAADQVAELIRSGEFSDNGKLPAERDLARLLGVSRPTVREALIALEIAGLIEVRTGSGAFIRPRAPSLEEEARASTGDTGPSPFELLSARRVVEPPVAAHAAQTITPAELEGLMEAIELQESRRNGTHWEKLEADRLFHTRIAGATHNAVIIAIVDDLWKGMFGPIFAILSERTQLTNRQTMTLDDHRTIHACLARRDAPGAQAAMLAHLVHVEMTLMKAEEARRAG
jgi:DNA-binding FadR family transcriptional regulator